MTETRATETRVTETRVTECWPLHARFDGPIVMVGFGSIGRGTLPLIERHLGFDRSKFVVVAPDAQNQQHLLEDRALRFMKRGGNQGQLPRAAHAPSHGGPGRGMVVNLSVDTSSVDLMAFANDLGAFYIDTVVEPWPGLYMDRSRRPRRDPTTPCARASSICGATGPAASPR